MITNLENQNESYKKNKIKKKKHKRKNYTKIYFFFITSFSLEGALFGCVDAVPGALGHLLVGSFLASKGIVARTISIFIGVSFSTIGSWVTLGGFIALEATP